MYGVPLEFPENGVKSMRVFVEKKTMSANGVNKHK